jgi:hypothetical protein
MFLVLMVVIFRMRYGVDAWVRSGLLRCAVSLPRGYAHQHSFSTISAAATTSSLPILLVERNPHALDEYVTFDEESHTYCFDGKPMRKSVTQLIDGYFSKFHPDNMIAKMMNGPNWPRPEYTSESGVPFTAHEIKDEWQRVSLRARQLGTQMHASIERMLNQERPINEDLPELRQFSNFHKLELVEKRQYKPYRTEWRVAAPDLGIGGCIDFVCQLPDGSFGIMDWKRSKKLPKSTGFSFGKKAL